MRVALFLASDGWGGAEKLVASLANALVLEPEIESLGVVCFDDSRWLPLLNEKVKVLPIGKKRSRYSLLQLWRLYRQLSAFKPDVIHSHSARATGMTQLLARWLPGLKIATKHNARKGAVFNRMTNVVAVSRQVADSIRGKATVIYNGVASKTLAYSEPEPEFTLLAVGRLDPIKQYAHLIQAVADMQHPVRLWIAGEGPEHDRLQGLVHELGMDDRIILLGARHDIPELMARTQSVVICSRTEGFSLVMVESLFYANMLLSTDVGGASEVLPREQIYELEHLTARLDTLVDNYERESERFLQLKRERAHDFTTERMAHNHVRYYRCALGRVSQLQE